MDGDDTKGLVITLMIGTNVVSTRAENISFHQQMYRSPGKLSPPNVLGVKTSGRDVHGRLGWTAERDSSPPHPDRREGFLVLIVAGCSSTPSLKQAWDPYVPPEQTTRPMLGPTKLAIAIKFHLRTLMWRIICQAYYSQCDGFDS